MRSLIHIIGYTVQKTLTSPRFYITLLLAAGGLYLCFGGTRSYLLESGQTLQAVELYIFSNSSRVSQWIITLGFLLMLGDAPFLKAGMSLRLIRTNRKTWLLGQIFSCLLMIILYQFLIACILIGMFWGLLSFQNTWSDALLMAARIPNGGLSLQIEMAIDFPMSIVQGGSPYAMFGLTFLYSTLLLSFFSMVLIACNLRLRNGIGYLAVTAFLALQLLLNQLMPASPIRYLSPCNLAALGERSVTFIGILYTILFFAVSCWLLGLLAYRFCLHSDLIREEYA